MTPIFIIGYMGCGKTTFGRALAAATGLQFIDLDQYIEQRQHATVRQIFDLHGESGFRKIERDLLHEVADFEDCIISCGGGTPCFFDNISHMKSKGTTLWLKANEDVLLERLVRKREKRPLLAGKTDEEIRELIGRQLEQRSPYYSQASIIWEGNTLDNRRQIDRTVADFLKEHDCGIKNLQDSEG